MATRNTDNQPNMTIYEEWEPTYPALENPTDEQWATVRGPINKTHLGMADEEEDELNNLLSRLYEITMLKSKEYVDARIEMMKEYINPEFDGVYTNTRVLQDQVTDIKRMLQLQTAVIEAYQAQVKGYKDQIDSLSIEAGGGGAGGKGFQIPEPPTFSGPDSKIWLKDWVNQIALYNAHYGIITDKHQIVTALTRLRGSAATYSEKYFEILTKGEDLGTFKEFIDDLSIYGVKNDKESARKELTALWNNTSLAQKDFIKYAKQYRTLARIAGYNDDKLLIDKLKDVSSKELHASVTNNLVPKTKIALDKRH